MHEHKYSAHWSIRSVNPFLGNRSSPSTGRFGGIGIHQSRARIGDMKTLFPAIILILAGFAFSQSADRAVPTYSVNDKLVGISNLYGGLLDCSIRSVAGKVKHIELLTGKADVTVKVDKKTKVKVIVPLDRVAEADRKSLFRHLLTKRNVLRLSGYACDPEAPFSAFSVDRVY